MKDSKEFLGFIVKKEKLGSFEPTFGYTDMILEDMDPFPGYYHVVPGDMKEDKPKFAFLVIKPSRQLNGELIVRKTLGVKEHLRYPFDASPGELVLFNKTKSCIRICVKEYHFMQEIIDAYKAKDIEFVKGQRVKPFQSLIKVLKYFEVEEAGEGIYHDKDDKDMYYIQMPGELDWEKFEEITMLIKNNIDYKNFDAAIASFYEKTRITDYARIYCEIEHPDILTKLKKAYHKEIKRMP